MDPGAEADDRTSTWHPQAEGPGGRDSPTHVRSGIPCGTAASRLTAASDGPPGLAIEVPRVHDPGHPPADPRRGLRPPEARRLRRDDVDAMVMSERAKPNKVRASASGGT